MTLPDKDNVAPSAFHSFPGETQSSWLDTYRSVSPAGSVIPLHSHSCYELIYCRSVFHTHYQLEDQLYTLQPGDILFLAPGVLHCPILPKSGDEPYIRDVIQINPVFLETVYSTFLSRDGACADKTGLYRIDGILGASIGELFRKAVLEAETKETGWEAAVAANLLSIITQLHRAMAQKKPRKPERAELLEQMLAYVELHWSEKLTMADMAHHFFISESTITQTFRKNLGISFYRCVTQRRLSAAKNLIEQGLPLETVAEQSGFSDYSSFFRAFKQEYEVSPRQYRKTYLTEGKQ